MNSLDELTTLIAKIRSEITASLDQDVSMSDYEGAVNQISELVSTLVGDIFEVSSNIDIDLDRIAERRAAAKEGK